MSQNFEKIEKNSIIFKLIFFFHRKIQFKKNFFKVFWAKFKHIKKGKKLKSERFFLLLLTVQHFPLVTRSWVFNFVILATLKTLDFPFVLHQKIYFLTP